MLGTLARLGLDALTSYEGQSVFPLAWVQATGCLVMGFAVGLREPITQFSPSLYTAITTGFCGSLTTFSSWNLDMFLAFSNASGARRIWLYDAVDGLSHLFVTFSVSLSSLALGLHLAKLVLPFLPVKITPLSPLIQYIISALSIVSYILTIPLYFILSHAFRPQATSALLFAFPGTLTRYILSVTLNPRIPSFPLGTFAANIFATALIGAFHTLQHRDNPLISHVSCEILKGLSDGYCGCLSTVSTFAVEVRALKRKAWVYAAASLIVAQISLVLIAGVPRWSGVTKESSMCSYE
ncbi:CrcB-like protein-domain-containing protein [Cantharellus anzutake]|uniref:CrcB-like protein-domain-containing protein n=1 Tax=Cantharellus anzutake TaxID=1750568 RepID=UPI0019043776|nr:CrcB-like protein-domain-containing protein [Cantharellus anzutake]KAF8335060.1 CrcB-like protein-domain-containing protein [Cantharellus anzutake]